MVSEVLPSPSLASVIFVGVIGRPTFLQKAVLTVHADVHPVSHTRSSVVDFDGSNSLVISTGQRSARPGFLVLRLRPRLEVYKIRDRD